MKITPEQYKAALKTVKEYRNQLKAELARVENEVGEAKLINPLQKNSTLYEVMSSGQCSVRLHNVIYNNREALGIKSSPGHGVRLVDLEGLSILKLLSCRNAGEGTVNEFKDLCNSYGIRWTA
ncbi:MULTISPECIES: hypothetical protein [Arenibacter]|uniref:hypothetical protein n=1 Tax=Arenibacter TaxID=178469 RepID=UPI0004DF269E|nr:MULTISPECIES: hypothetical protein [Arenibacter]GBF19534.1 hypothetical protein C21_01702 [Arenibacter sp. NBRC 103722]